jgi:hypothetical protein
VIGNMRINHDSKTPRPQYTDGTNPSSDDRYSTEIASVPVLRRCVTEGSTVSYCFLPQQQFWLGCRARTGTPRRNWPTWVIGLTLASYVLISVSVVAYSAWVVLHPITEAVAK